MYGKRVEVAYFGATILNTHVTTYQVPGSINRHMVYMYRDGVTSSWYKAERAHGK